MRKIRNEIKDIRAFSVTLAIILMIFGAIHSMKHQAVLSKCFFGIGLTVLCVSLFRPRALKPVYSLFLKATHAIGWFNARVILILIYFLLVTPIAIIMKIIGKDPLNRKMNKNALTYWVKRPLPIAAREQLEKQF